LLLLLLCNQLGYDAGRFISLERLYRGKQGALLRNTGAEFAPLARRNTIPGLTSTFALYILKSAYKEFEERVDTLKTPKGMKTDVVEAAIRIIEGSLRYRKLKARVPE